MTNHVTFIFTLSFSLLFGVDIPKEIETPSQKITEIQFDAEAFQQNQLIKKRLQESYKQTRKAKGIPKPVGKPVHNSRKKGSEPLGKHFQKLESIKVDLNLKNFFGDFNSKSAHKKETAKADYLTRRNEMKQKRAFAPKKQNSMILHGNDMSSYPTEYRTENNGQPTIQNIRNREIISFFDYHDVHANVSNWQTTNATFEVETEAGPEAGEDALQWVELGETGATRSKVGWTFYPYIDLSSVWESVGMSDHWFRIEIKTDYSGDLKVYFSDGPGRYQILTVTVQGTGLWETYELPLSDTSPTTGANATDFNTSDIYSLSIQDFNHEEGRTFDIGVIEIYSPADDEESGWLIVHVFNLDNNPINGAHVSVWNDEFDIDSMTDENGHTIVELPEGYYEVDAWAEGFESEYYGEVEILSNSETSIDFMLEPDQDFELTNFEININGVDVADIEAGESATVTIEFEDTGAEPYAGMLAIFYDANFNDYLDPEDDINFFEEDGEGQAVLLVDNMDPDENPDIGIIELTLDAQDDDGPGFLTLIQNTSWLFSGYDPDMDDFDSIATLNVSGFESGYSISGDTDPSTANMMVSAIMADSAGNNWNREPHITLTQENGSYHVDVADTGFYLISMDDGLEIYDTLYASPSFQFVEVSGHEARNDFEIMAYDALVSGIVTNPEGEGIWDAEINFSYHDDNENIHIESDAWTDETGYYELWLQEGYEYYAHVRADGYMYHHNDSVYIEGENFDYNVTLEPWNNHEWGVIEGTVWDQDGNGIEGASVNVWDNSGSTWSNHTGRDGYYSLDQVPSGYYEMEVSAEGYSTEWNTVEVQANETTIIDFWLNRVEEDMTQLYGQVTNLDGELLEMVKIVAHRLSGGYLTTFTNGEGYYEMDLPENGYNFSVRREGYWVTWSDSIYVSGDEMELNWTVEPVEQFDGAWEGNINLVGEYEPESIYLSIYNPTYEVGRILEGPGFQNVPLVNGSYHLFANAEGYQGVLMFDAIHIDNNVVNFDINLFEEGLVLPPHINHASDVPNDQGRQMRLTWSPGNPGEWGYFEFYSIWRKVNDAPMNLWDFIDVVPWHGSEPYSAVVPTLGDSTDMGIYWSTFRVTGHTEDLNEFYDSAPFIGYSIDNLHPGVPEGVQAFTGGDGILLTWDSPMDEDFSFHRIYRHNMDSGDPAIEFTTVDTFYVDDVAEGNHEYWITAVDLNGNESDPSIIVTVTLAIDNELAVPMEFALQQNYPNPFNPSTQIQYALPTDANVTIAIYDLVGRHIRTLVNGQVNAGYHSTLWNATNEMGSPVSAGVYIYTITANDFRDVKKMILLK